MDLLKDKNAAVRVEILTKEQSAKPSVTLAANAFNQQYKGLELRTSNVFHDRFVIIDDEDVYHFGASIKDAGKSGFMFTRIEGPDMKEAVRRSWTAAWGAAKLVT